MANEIQTWDEINKVMVVRDATVEELAEIAQRAADRIAAAAAKAAEVQQLTALKLKVKNSTSRKQAKIDQLEKLLFEQLDNDDLAALRTQAKINQLKEDL